MATVSRIAVARLFNLGRYEHVRYEVAVDLSPEDDAGATLEALSRNLEALAPISDELIQGAEFAARMLAKPAGEMTAHDVQNLDHYKELATKLGAANSARKEALAALSSMWGGIDRKHSEPRSIASEEDEP